MEHDADALPETLVFNLKKPIEFQKGKYDQLILREPTARQMLDAEGHMRRGINPETVRLRDIHLIAAVSGWPVPVAEQLPVSVLVRGAKYLMDFTLAGQRTGEI